MILHQANPLGLPTAWAYATTIRVKLRLEIGLGSLNITLTVTLILAGQQLHNVTPCNDNAALLI